MIYIKFYDTKMGWCIDEAQDEIEADEKARYRESQGYKVMVYYNPEQERENA